MINKIIMNKMLNNKAELLTEVKFNEKLSKNSILILAIAD